MECQCKCWWNQLMKMVVATGLLLNVVRSDHVHLVRSPIQIENIIDEDYDPMQTPPNSGKPIDVSIQIEFLNIRNVDVSEMSFVADIFLYKTWRDSRLKFPADKSQIQKLSLPTEWKKYLWTPDVFFYNAIEGKVLETIIPYMYLWLRNDSTVIFGVRLSLQFSCDMLLHYFPHDTQTCDIILKSLTHTISELNIHWNEKDSISVGDFIILPQFELSTPEPSPCDEHHFLGKHGKFSCLRGLIKLTRRSGYYVINIYIPTILIVFMSMLTFWIPVDAVPGRVTLGVTSSLTIITKQYQASLPNVSYVVALNYWLSVCIGFVFCGLLEYAAVIAIANHQRRVVPEVDKLALKDRNLCCKYWDAVSERFEGWIQSFSVLRIDRICRVGFPLAFVVHCIAYYFCFVER